MSRWHFFAPGLLLLLCVQPGAAQATRPPLDNPAAASGDTRNVGSIRGRVALPNSAPLTQAVRITLQTPQGSEFVTYTDFQGQFELRSIPVGNYRLQAEADFERFEVETQSIQVMRGLPTTITFTLREKTASARTRPGTSALVSTGELDPNVPKAARKEYERAEKAADEGKPVEAMTHLRRALDIYPGFMMAHNNLGAQLLEAERLEEATVELRRAVDLDPKAFNPHFNLGLVLLKQKQFAAAAKLLDEAIALDPQAPSAHLYAGVAHLNLKEFDRAEKELLRAHEIGGAQYALALFYLGQLYRSKGDRPQALASFELYLRELPDAPNAAEVRRLIGTLR